MICSCDQLRKLVAQVRPVGRMSLEPWYGQNLVIIPQYGYKATTAIIIVAIIIIIITK